MCTQDTVFVKVHMSTNEYCYVCLPYHILTRAHTLYHIICYNGYLEGRKEMDEKLFSVQEINAFDDKKFHLVLTGEKLGFLLQVFFPFEEKYLLKIPLILDIYCV